MSSLSQAIRLLPEICRTRNFADISPVFTRLGSPINNACRILNIVNNTDNILSFSIDGTNLHFVLPALSAYVIDVTSNRADTGGALSIATFTQFYVAGSPTTGDVYMTVWYATT